MNLEKYGFIESMLNEADKGVPARVIAVHKERYKLICEQGECYARLKTKEYFVDGDDFPRPLFYLILPSSQKAIAPAAPTLRESTLCDIGILTV